MPYGKTFYKDSKAGENYGKLREIRFVPQQTKIGKSLAL